MEYGTVEILKLLASDIRFTALVMLKEAGKGVPAGMIAEHCRVTAQGASQQLGTLKLAGLVTSEKRGNAVLYQLAIPIHPLVHAALFYDGALSGKAGLVPLFFDLAAFRVHYPEGIPSLGRAGEETVRAALTCDAGREA